MRHTADGSATANSTCSVRLRAATVPRLLQTDQHKQKQGTRFHLDNPNAVPHHFYHSAGQIACHTTAPAQRTDPTCDHFRAK